MNIEDLEIGELYEKVFNTIPDAIAILNKKHRIVRVNNAMADMMGVRPDDLKGKFCYEVVHGTDGPIENCPHSLLLQDKLEHASLVHEENLGGFFQVTTTPLLDDEEQVIGAVHVARDMTERMIIEKQLENALEDKDMMMKEVHHRVKNNLMIISSLLNLQARNIKDSVTRDIFRDSQSRAKCMALIHEKLYRSGDLKKIEMSDYIQSLIKDLCGIYMTDNSLKIETNLEKAMIDINTVIPLGLVLNELLTNAFKYAYPKGEKGIIKVNFTKIDDQYYLLEVSDNGVGLPSKMDPYSPKTLGMQLINNLASQLQGEIDIESTQGTDVKIKFKELKYNSN
jgi:PAS domain S-box-containing protein